MPGQKRIPISHNNIATSPGLEKRKMASVDCKAISGSSVIDFYFSDSSLRNRTYGRFPMTIDHHTYWMQFD